MSECFERLLIQTFVDQQGGTDSSNADALACLMTNLDGDTLKACSDDDTVKEYIHEFQLFQQKVRDGYLGKTAVFWMSFLSLQYVLLHTLI